MIVIAVWAACLSLNVLPQSNLLIEIMSNMSFLILSTYLKLTVYSQSYAPCILVDNFEFPSLLNLEALSLSQKCIQTMV